MPRSPRPSRRRVTVDVRARFALSMWCAAGVMAGPALADLPPPIPTPAEVIVPVGVDSGVLMAPPTSVAARGEHRRLFVADLIAPAGTPWVRVPLHGVVLPGEPGMGDGAYVVLTSLLDGGTQRLDADAQGLWRNWSAGFNGPAVRLELFAFAGTGQARVRIDSIVAGADLVEPATICDSTDDRMPVLDLRVARGGGGCSVWTIGDLNGGMLSAGHCATAVSSTVQFNVPPSSASGAVQLPPPEDQYPMDLASRQFLSGGQGNDWLYIGVFPNSNHGLLPRQRYGVWVDVGTAAPASGAHTFRVTGYGTSSIAVRNQVEQTHTGPFFSLTGTVLRYRVDTTGGNSGSPVFHESGAGGNGQSVAIHTHAGCTSTGGSNVGTAIQNAGLRTALLNPLGVSASGRGTVEGSLYLIGDRQNNFGTVNAAPKRFAKVAQFGAFWQGLAWSRTDGAFFAINSAGELFRIESDAEAVPMGTVTNAGGGSVGTLLTSLAFHPASGLLYAAAPAASLLYSIDPATRVATPVGSPQAGSVRALEWDTRRHRLVGVQVVGTAHTLVAIDTTSGVRTPLGPLNLASLTIGDLAYDEDQDALFAVNAGNGALLRIDPVSGAAVQLGLTGGVFGPAFGMASTTACRADLNRDGQVNPDDLGDFIDCYFSPGCPAADFNADSVIDPDDLGDFINLFFSGVC